MLCSHVMSQLIRSSQWWAFFTSDNPTSRNFSSRLRSPQSGRSYFTEAVVPGIICMVWKQAENQQSFLYLTVHTKYAYK